MSARRKIRITGKSYNHVKTLVNESVASVTVGSTTDLSDLDGNYVLADGAGVTITGFGVVQAGAERVIKFNGANTLTHNNPQLLLPGGVDIIVAEGDTAILRSEGDGNWTCIAYTRASGEGLGSPRYSFSYPADPTGSTTDPGVMMGLGLGISPNRSGVLQVIVTGNMQSDTADSVVSANLRIGVGTAPANGDAATGTAISSTSIGTMYGANKKQPFTLTAIVEGLALGVQEWIDIALSNGGDASLAQLSELQCNIVEL